MSTCYAGQCLLKLLGYDMRDIELFAPANESMYKLSISGNALQTDNALQRVITLLLIHSSPANEYTLDGLHPQDLIARATTGGMDSCLERLNIIGASLVSDINNDLEQTDADPSDALSSISFTAREGESASSPVIVVQVVRVTGESTIAEITTHE